MPSHKGQQSLSEGNDSQLQTTQNWSIRQTQMAGVCTCGVCTVHPPHTFVFLLHYVSAACQVSMEAAYRLIDTDFSQSLVYLYMTFTSILISSTGRLLCRSSVHSHSYWEFMCTPATETRKTAFYGNPSPSPSSYIPEHTRTIETKTKKK